MLQIASGADVKVVQDRLRHASAAIDAHGHLWPEFDEPMRAAMGAVVVARMESRQNQKMEAAR
ncbi:tyrosine-type recombinase/integrase [Microtetraspora malaysiensis]|uniref:tyrosine-type recombinase/integrase n=1 Tax=Microtetraspora malaysiensis TaxID=161358 RepID=UPI003D8AB003